MKTPEQIQLALSLCKRNSCNKTCPYHGESACYVKLHSDAFEYIQQLENQIGGFTEKVEQIKEEYPKWISVEDRLPEREVLAANFAPRTYGYKEYIIGYVSRGTEPGKCYASNDYEILYNVTHWMPLPDAPEVNA